MPVKPARYRACGGPPRDPRPPTRSPFHDASPSANASIFSPSPTLAKPGSPRGRSPSSCRAPRSLFSPPGSNWRPWRWQGGRPGRRPRPMLPFDARQQQAEVRAWIRELCEGTVLGTAKFTEGVRASTLGLIAVSTSSGSARRRRPHRGRGQGALAGWPGVPYRTSSLFDAIGYALSGGAPRAPAVPAGTTGRHPDS